MKIVVGIREMGSQPALEWAMEFAKNREATIELVHVVDTRSGYIPVEQMETALLAAEEKLRDFARSVQDTASRVLVASHVRVGSPVNELVAAAEGADFLVVGANPKERYDGAGRRTVRIARLAPCSVVVVPSRVIPEGTGVVVGIDGSDDSQLALDFAAELADRQGETLTVLLAWGRPDSWAIAQPDLVVTEPSEDDRLLLAESVAGLAERYPDLVVRTEVSASRPARGLYAASIDTRMLVVGSHGHHTLAKALLGSTSEELVADLPCAVAIIRGAASTS
jgi:nucleotide-binding universal stress UspA family protein